MNRLFGLSCVNDADIWQSLATTRLILFVTYRGLVICHEKISRSSKPGFEEATCGWTGIKLDTKISTGPLFLITLYSDSDIIEIPRLQKQIRWTRHYLRL